MNKTAQWLCIMCTLFLPIFGPSQEWVARYDGTANGHDEAVDIAVDDVGNIYVTGWSAGSGTGHDFATVKYDANGVEQWVARYNGPNNDEDGASAIAVDNAGNVYVTGPSLGPMNWPFFDYVTVKYDAAGVEQWVARYDGPASSQDVAEAIVLDDAGNIYVTGKSGESATSPYVFDYATIKYDANGVEQWVARYNGPDSGSDLATAIGIDAAGNIYVTGMSEGPLSDFDYATVRYNSAGVEQWAVRYHGPINEEDEAWAIAVDDSGNAYVTGFSFAGGYMIDYATVKYDANGVEQWAARYHGPYGPIAEDMASAIAIDDAGNVYVTGTSWCGPYNGDYATVKYDAAGVEQWVGRYNGPLNAWDAASAIVVDDAGNSYVTGGSVGSGTFADYATVKYDAMGIEQWVVRYNGPANGNDGASAIVLDNAGNVYITGSSEGNNHYDYATIKYVPTGIEENIPSVEIGNEITVTIFYGPLQLPKGKKCKVFDIIGRVVEPNRIQPGIYFIEVDGVVTQKVVKVR